MLSISQDKRNQNNVKHASKTLAKSVSRMNTEIYSAVTETRVRKKRK